MNDLPCVSENFYVALVNDAADQLVPVILSGGSGSRLWPVSRESFPKPVLGPAEPRPLHDRGNRPARARTRLCGPRCGLQQRTPLPRGRAVAGRRDQRRPHRAGAGRPQLRPRRGRRGPAGGTNRPAGGDLDDGGGQRHRGCGRTARHAGEGGRRGAGRPHRHPRHEADRARDRLRLHGSGRGRGGGTRRARRRPASSRSPTPPPPPPWSPAARCGMPACSSSGPRP